jgi:hypothetical protein
MGRDITWDDLEKEFFTHEKTDGDKFIRGGVEMLDGVMAFWNGLNEDRIKREKSRRLAS